MHARAAATTILRCIVGYGGLPSSTMSTAVPAAAAIELPASRHVLEIQGKLQSGHEISVTMPKSATEQEMFSLLSKRFAEEGMTDQDEIIALTGQLMAMKIGYNRTRYWFEQGGSRRVFQDYLGDLANIADDRPISVLEIGSFEGGSALWFAEHLLKHTDSQLVCLDTWDGSPEIGDVDMPSVEDRFRWNMRRSGNAGRIHAIKGDSMLSLSTLIATGRSASFDVIYVDASHQMAEALADCLLAFRLLKVEGIMIIDDELLFPQVAEVTATLERALGEDFVVLYRKSQVVGRKASSSSASPGLIAMGEKDDKSLSISVTPV